MSEGLFICSSDNRVFYDGEELQAYHPETIRNQWMTEEERRKEIAAFTVLVHTTGSLGVAKNLSTILLWFFWQPIAADQDWIISRDEIERWLDKWEASA